MKNITQSKNSTFRSKIINFYKLFSEKTKMKKIFIGALTFVLLFCSFNKAEAATFTVINTNDAGAGSLRQAIIDANIAAGADIINFNAGVIGTITLVSALPDIIDPLTITGPGADVLSVSGNNTYRVFFITGGVTVNINNLTITDGNVASNGGGIYVDGSILNLNNSVVSNNNANAGAGLCILPNILIGSATVTNSTISGNTATTVGGGILTGSDGFFCSTLIITNSTISSNSSATGGGIAAYCPSFGPVTITNSTISNNSANANSGGGIFNQASVTLINSIVANSTGGDIVNLGGTTDAQYSLVEDGLGINGTNTNNLSGDPLLGPLANNGGSTFTHKLLPGSIAIDKGSAVGGLTTDQRGLTRIKDFPSIANATAGNGSDIGAFEVQCIVDPIVINNNDAGAGSLRQAIIDACPGSTITFDPIVFSVPQTITLASKLPSITNALTITGPGANLLSVSGNNLVQVFDIINTDNFTYTVSISGLSIINGNASPVGGILQSHTLQATTLIISNCIFSNNTGDDGAGAIYAQGFLTVNNCTFNNNSAVGLFTFSGGIYGGNTLTLSNSTFTNNQGYTGGAVYIYNGTITNCTFNGNSAYQGGAIYIGGNVTITNCTVSGNSCTAFGTGGGMAIGSGTGSIINVRNTIVAGNTAPSGPDLRSFQNSNPTFPTFTSLGYNLIGNNDLASWTNAAGDQVGTPGTPINPLLGAIADNGGSTFTMALLANSPAIDKGSAVAGLTTDQRGLTRPKDFPSIANAAAGNGSDIGAFEVQCIADPIVINNNNSGAGSLRQAVIDACPGSTITFDMTTVISPILLSDGQIILSKNLTIQGPGANTLTVQNTKAISSTSRVFIVNAGVTATISSLTISGGNVNSFAGGIFNNGGTLTLTNSTISGNTSTVNCGGIYNNGGTLTVTNSTISGNTSTVNCGGIYNNGGTLTLTNSTISGNTSTSFGGGIYNNSGGTLTVTNSTISGNTSYFGGGIFNNNGVTLTVTNSTISGNSASGSGGGIFNNTSGTVNSNNTIIAGNTANTATDGPDFFGNLTSQGYNLIGNPSGMSLIGGSNDIVNPAGGAMLGPLANNGGPTMTHALLPGSPAIDKGSFVAGITTDQRDSIRPFDNPSITNAAGGNGSDIGAFESQTVAPVLSINDVTQTEVNSGTSLFTFTVSLSTPAEAGGVTFDIATQNNSASTANNDYVLKSLTSQSIPAGNSTYSFDVTVNGDVTFEPDETFFVNVTNVTGATVSDGQGLGTIINDDCASGSQTFNYNGGVQDFVVPTGITFLTVAATGADGGDSSPGAAAFGGSGGVINATFPVLPGDNIRVIVGEAGKSTFSGGGGGGTAVINCGNPANCATGTLLLVAGGGGGGFSAGTPGGGASSIAGTGNGGVSIVGNGGGGGVNSPGSGLAFGGGQASKTSISSGGTGLSNGGKGFGGGGAKEVGFLFGGAGGGGYSGGKGTDGVTSTTGGSNFIDATAVSGFTNNGGTTGGSGGDNTNGVVALSYSCNVCPTIAALSATSSPVCQNANTTLNATGLAGMGIIYGIEFKYFTSPTATPYAGGTTIATVTNGSLGAGGTTASTITSFAIAGTYYIYAVLSPIPVDDACRPYATATTIVNQNPTPSISGSLSFCDGSSTILDAGKYFGYMWSTNETTQTISVNTAEIFTVTVSDQNGCTGSASVTTILNPNPTPSISGALSFCDGSSTTLDAGFYSGYAWSTLATSQTISVNTAGTFTVTVSDQNGCTGSASVTTSINQNPTPTISGALSFCDGSSTTLDAGAYAGYLWSTLATSQTISVNTAGTFSVVVTDINGCTGSASATTIKNTNPTPSISGNLSFCSGSSTTLNAGVYAGYLWSTLATTQTISINTAGTFSVKVTDANGCTGTTSVITSIKTYTIGAISGLDGVCAKQSGVVYCVTNPSPGILSYIWTLPTGASAIGATNGVCITLKFSSRFKGGSICVKAVTPCGNTQSLCKNIVLITKTPNTPGAISGPSTLCPNATATYSIIAVPTATSYLWSVPSNMQILSGQGSISVVVKALSNFNSGYVKVRAMNCKDGSGTKSMTLVKSRSCKESAKSIFESTIESDLLTGFSVYPNPASGKLTITFISVSKTKVKLNIMDLVGKNILMNEVEAVEGTNTKQIDLTHLAKGMYFISFVIEGMKVQPFRIVVE